MPKYILRGSISCVQGTPGAEPLPCAMELPGETVFTKNTFDGFHHPQLEGYLRQKGRRFLLTAGLITSVCVLFTSVSAMQKGFLAAVVEDCCADEPDAHLGTLDRYQFIIERTSLNSIIHRQSKWLADLEKLEASKASVPG